jgi:hypothetical protein
MTEAEKKIGGIKDDRKCINYCNGLPFRMLNKINLFGIFKKLP